MGSQEYSKFGLKKEVVIYFMNETNKRVIAKVVFFALNWNLQKVECFYLIAK